MEDPLNLEHAQPSRYPLVAVKDEEFADDACNEFATVFNRMNCQANELPYE